MSAVQPSFGYQCAGGDVVFENVFLLTLRVKQDVKVHSIINAQCNLQRQLKNINDEMEPFSAWWDE